MPTRLSMLTALLITFTLPLTTEAQQAARAYRMALLCAGSGPNGACRFIPEQGDLTDRAIADGLRTLGYVVGQNLIVESAGGSVQEQAAEFVRRKVDLIFVYVCDTALKAAREATRTIPIVVGACNDDLVAAGIVKSLARPGGNITGLSKVSAELAAKRLELLKEIAPRVSQVAVLWNPAYSDVAADWRHLRAAAQVLGVTLHPVVEVRKPDELEAAFATIAREHADAVITFSDTLTWAHAKRVAALAVMHRLPWSAPFRESPDVGGLISYGPNLLDMYRQSASYIDRILKGAKPGDLPIEQPTKFEMVINAKTAKALGLTIPQSLLLRADEVIQ